MQRELSFAWGMTYDSSRLLEPMPSTGVALEGSGLVQLDVAVTEVLCLVLAAGVWACWATAIVASVVGGTCGGTAMHSSCNPHKDNTSNVSSPLCLPVMQLSRIKPFADLLGNAVRHVHGMSQRLCIAMVSC